MSVTCYHRRSLCVFFFALSFPRITLADTPPHEVAGEKPESTRETARISSNLSNAGESLPAVSDADEAESLFVLPENKPDSRVAKPAAIKAVPSRASSLPSSQTPPAEITVNKYRKLRWSPQGERFSSPGPVKVIYTDTTTGKATTLNAQNIEYDAQRGFAKASGGIQLEREEGQFAGEAIEYNFRTDAGFVTSAILLSTFFRMRGDRIERKEDGTYVVQNGYFTTCENQKPDYQIRAGLLTVSPNRFVSARRITFYAGNTGLISLPAYRQNLRATSPLPIPRVSYNKVEGLSFRQVGSPINRPNETLDFDLRVNFRRLPAGFLVYQKDLSRQPVAPLPPFGMLYSLEDPLRGFLEQLSPPTYQEYGSTRYQEVRTPRTLLFGTLQNDQYIYNRRRSDLQVSRFPEFGVRWTNILGRSLPKKEGAEATPPVSSMDASLVRQRQENTPFILDVSASLGAMRELPTRTTSGRLSVSTSVGSQPWILSPNLSLRVGVTNWLNIYSKGNIYNLISPEIDLHYLPTSTTFFSIGYRYAADVGSTPFIFDRRDVRHELRLRAQFGGPWAFGIMTRYDLERTRAYDTEFAILRNFDCMQIGIGYRARAQQFGIIFNLLPPTPNRAERRIEPLTPQNVPPESDQKREK